MKELTAVFTVTLAEPLLCFAESDTFDFPIPHEASRVTVSQDEFTVELRLSGFGGVGRGAAAGPLAREIFEVTLLVTSPETETPPVIVTDESGRRDLTPLQKYVSEREPKYSAVCEKILARMAWYFRFVRGHALVRPELFTHHSGLVDPAWVDDAGELVWNRKFTVSATASASLMLFPECEVRPYRAADHSGLQRYLGHDTQASLHEELLAEARDAIAVGHIRRAVLELAIACESGVKFHYFTPESHADAAYAYLEDKNRVNARVLDFLDPIAVRAFGQSLKSDHPDQYQEIDWLFRCRNKVAHRGRATFRDDAGQEHVADRAQLVRWWAAVAGVFQWLKDFGAKQGPLSTRRPD